MICVCDRTFYARCKVTMGDSFTYDIVYEVLYTTDKDGKIFYELENNKGEYTSIDSKYFEELV